MRIRSTAAAAAVALALPLAACSSTSGPDSEGAGGGRIFWSVTLPVLLATSLLGFITAWNEFAFADMLIIKNQDDRTLPVWLSSFSNVFGTDWGATMAASTLFALPVLVLFLVLQRRVSAGMTGGAVKG